ncbi:TPA: hypothetical protein DD617_03515, partial [Candidatus Uhrbacteria bacterium]|nr:hypothetical protein [Candidatus Uhrbacteria bacterium]
YDYLRVLFARVGRPHCPKCLREIHKLTNEEMVDVVLREVGEGVRGGQKDRGVQEAQGAQGKRKTGEVIKILAPVVRGRKGEYYQLLYDL